MTLNERYGDIQNSAITPNALRITKINNSTFVVKFAVWWCYSVPSYAIRIIAIISSRRSSEKLSVEILELGQVLTRTGNLRTCVSSIVLRAWTMNIPENGHGPGFGRFCAIVEIQKPTKRNTKSKEIQRHAPCLYCYLATQGESEHSRGLHSSGLPRDITFDITKFRVGLSPTSG
jgi:hypothetical protein